MNNMFFFEEEFKIDSKVYVVIIKTKIFSQYLTQRHRTILIFSQQIFMFIFHVDFGFLYNIYMFILTVFTQRHSMVLIFSQQICNEEFKIDRKVYVTNYVVIIKRKYFPIAYLHQKSNGAFRIKIKQFKIARQLLSPFFV